MACALLHNLFLQNMSRDPMKDEDETVVPSMEITKGEVNELEFITCVLASNEWTNFRDVLAQGLYNNYRASSSSNN